MENEAVDISKLGVELIVISVLIATVTIFALLAQNMFAKEEYRKYEIQYMNENAENWTFESRATKAENAYFEKGTLDAVTSDMKVTGNDIVNFIIKNDTKYNYYIYPEMRGILPENEKPHKLLRETVESGVSNNIYSEENLLKMIRTGDTNSDTNLTSSFYVKIILFNDEPDTFIFSRSGKVKGDGVNEVDIYNYHPN